MTLEDVLQLVCTVAIHLHLAAEVVFAITGRLEHGCHGILCRMAGAARECIEHARGEHQSEGQTFVTSREVVVMAMEQLVRDARHANAFAGIAEGLRPGDKQDVVVGIMGHGGLVGGLEGLREVLTEVHGKVGQVFHDDGIVLRGQFANGLQLLLRHAYPCRIVRVGVDNGADIAHL